MGRSDLLTTRQFVKRLLAFLFCISLIFPLTAAADDADDHASSMLENLKRRSAEERWQRIKRLYPAEPLPQRQGLPAAISDEGTKAATEERVPPSPEETPLIPRLTVLPANTSTDWIIPARPAPIEEPVSVPSPEAPSSVEPDKSETRSFRATPRIAAQDVDTSNPSPTPLEEETVRSSPRNALVRKIGEINPYYDRERDTDIREFAQEKAREYEGLFRPKPFEERMFPRIALEWDPSDLFYYPLYFSDPPLERYGHSYHPWLQPFVSIARFSTQFVFLPYQMTIEPICAEVSPLGWYRPGDCAPKLLYQPPLNAEAAIVEAGFVTGFYYLIVSP